MNRLRWRVIGAILIAVLLALLLAGCGGTALPSYTGGGLPPGDPDLGGVVFASADTQTTTAQTVPPDAERIVGAPVTLMRGQGVVGRTTTGDGGYFRFERPDTGNYTIVVEPPAGRDDLRGAQRNVSHTRGARTFVVIELQRVQQGPSDPGPGPGPQ